MTNVKTSPVKVSDAAELVAVNLASREQHAPWASPFTDHEWFDTWFGRMLTGPNRGFVAREASGNAIIGVVNITEIVWGRSEAPILVTMAWLARPAAAS